VIEGREVIPETGAQPRLSGIEENGKSLMGRHDG
jgi:hypothetical protein